MVFRFTSKKCLDYIELGMIGQKNNQFLPSKDSISCILQDGYLVDSRILRGTVILAALG